MEIYLVTLCVFLGLFHMSAMASADKFWSLHGFNYRQLASSQALGHQWAALVIRHATIWLAYSNNSVVSRKAPESSPTLPDEFSAGFSGWSRDYGEVYGNIAHEKYGWLSCSRFIMLLYFELSSFRENGFLVLLHIPRCSCWYLLLKAQEGRIEKTGTHTHTQDNYCNPPRACAPRVNDASQWLNPCCKCYTFLYYHNNSNNSNHPIIWTPTPPPFSRKNEYSKHSNIHIWN